jgi:hypothetical protein
VLFKARFSVPDPLLGITGGVVLPNLTCLSVFALLFAKSFSSGGLLGGDPTLMTGATVAVCGSSVGTVVTLIADTSGLDLLSPSVSFSAPSTLESALVVLDKLSGSTNEGALVTLSSDSREGMGTSNFGLLSDVFGLSTRAPFEFEIGFGALA